jgi:hypothetical protein
VLSTVEHPFIIRLFQTFQDEHCLYMVLEYAPGGELWKHLRRLRKFPNPVARFYAAEVVLALDYLHTHGVVYSDLKPENLMLDAAGHVKLVDFGFAVFVGEPAAPSLRGTLEYLAPETVESDGARHSVMVDWWALGCLIFEMLVGTPPFTDDFFPDKRAIFDKILLADVVFPWRSVSQAAKDLIQALMRRDPEERLGARGALEVQQHPWFKGTNWTLVLKRKVPAPCLAAQSGRPDEETSESPALRPAAPLNPEQQELFRDFGPYDTPRTPGLLRFSRPAWIVRRERMVREGPPACAADPPVPKPACPLQSSVLLGLQSGDLMRVLGHRSDPREFERHFRVDAVFPTGRLTREQQAVFTAFGAMSGSPTPDSPLLAPTTPNTRGAGGTDACSSGSMSSVNTDLGLGAVGRPWVSANPIAVPETRASDDVLDGWVLVQSPTIVTPSPTQICASEFEPWVVVEHSQPALPLAHTPTIGWMEHVGPATPCPHSAPTPGHMEAARRCSEVLDASA